MPSGVWSGAWSSEEWCRIREEFPVLSREVNGRRLVYLDSAASSLKCRTVVERMSEFYLLHYANVHRAVHTLAAEATSELELARQKVARFIGASPEEVVFTSGTTMAINLVVNSLLRSGLLRSGDTVLLSQVEHHANLVPWVRLAKFHGYNVAYIEADERGVIHEDAIVGARKRNPKIVSITAQSNVTGQVMPLKLVREVFDRSILIVDGAQFVPHRKMDVKELGVDFLVFSGHKMLAPSGVGVMYGRLELLSDLEPFLYGGEMIDKVTFEDATFREPPYRFEAGTPTIGDAVGLGYAIDFLESLGFEKIGTHVDGLAQYLLKRLSELDFVETYGPFDESHSSLVAFNLDGVHPHDVSHVLDEKFGIATRSGHHCAQPLMGVLKRGSKINFPNSTVRASVYLYNSKDDVDLLIEALRYVKKMFS